MNTPNSLFAAPRRHDLAEQAIAILCGIVLSWATIFLCAAPFTHELASARDFIAYWATGQHLVQHNNPYDSHSIDQLEREAGFPAKYTVAMMRNPPWGLLIAWPLGWMSVGVATLYWTLLQTGCYAWTLRLLWRLLGRPRDYVFGLAIAFTPALICLTMGQTTIFCALGLVLFLRYHEERPWLAGMALWLCLLKPQLFVPIGVVMMLWVIDRRAWRVLSGALGAMGGSLVLTYWMDAQAWPQYFAMVRDVHMELENVPCVSVLVRLATLPKAAWAQQIMPAATSVWAVGYYWRKRQQWDWQRHGAPLMMLSVLLAPYSWIYDQGLMAPGLLYAAFQTRLRWLLIVVGLGSVAVLGQLMGRLPIVTYWYLWPAPFWFGSYLLLMRYGKNDAQAAVQEAGSVAESSATGTISS